jgi:hypothetical protein
MIRLISAKYTSNNDARVPRQIIIAVQVDIQYDSKFTSRRGSPGRRDDQTQLLRKFFTAAIARPAKESH